MLATSPYFSSASHGFLPAVPSPLLPRSANIYGGRRPAFMSAPGAQKDVPFAKRPVKKAPSPQHDELKERRRNNFLRKVQDGREEKRFDARGEDIMRLDYMQRQRQWEAELAREAPQIPSDPPEEAEEEDSDQFDLPRSSGNAMQISSQPKDEVDDVLQKENEELEALLKFMPDADEDDGRQSQNLWSDDDDYDALFSEFMEQDAVTQQQSLASEHQQGEAMDMS